MIYLKNLSRLFGGQGLFGNMNRNVDGTTLTGMTDFSGSYQTYLKRLETLVDA